MEYAHNAFALEGVTGLGAQTLCADRLFLTLLGTATLTISEIGRRTLLCRRKYWREPSQFASSGQRPFAAYSLMAATYRGHPEIVKYLLSVKSLVNAVNVDSWTVLHIACNKGFGDIVKNFIGTAQTIQTIPQCECT